MSRLAGKTAIVTGGANGMGEATVRLFVEHGAKVVIGDIQDEAGQALADELGDAAVFVHMDVSQEADWANAVAAAQSLGTYNVLVNNAAVLLFKSITDTTPEDYLNVIRVNQLGTFLGIRTAIEPMKAAGCGSIINVSSIDGLHSATGLSAYSSSSRSAGHLASASSPLPGISIPITSIHSGAALASSEKAAVDPPAYAKQ